MGSRMLLMLIVTAGAAGGGSTRDPAPAPPDGSWREIAELFHRRLDEEGVVGGSLWMVQRGDVVHRELHGWADLETRRPVDDATIYHWASITKTVTAIAVLQLRDRGLLSLDDPAVRHVPELREVHSPWGPIEDVTVRHLLSHSAGFRGPTWPWGGEKPWHPFEPTRWEQLVAMMPYTELLFAPGSRFSYSNPGVIFLGRIIERLSGEDFEVYIDKNILEPLGMHSSYFDITPAHLLPHRSNNYTVAEGRAVANGLDFDTGITTSNGGLNAPLTDMSRYLAFLTGECPDDACRGVLARESLREMWRPVVPVEPGSAEAAERLPAGWKESMGLGFFVYERGDDLVIGHTGSQKSFRAFFYLAPATGSAVIGVTNTTGEADAEGIRAELRSRVLELVARQTTRPPPP